MRPETRELFHAAGIIVASLVVSALAVNDGLVYLPFPIIASGILTWVLRQPLRILIIIGLATELVTTLPPGIITLTMLAPLLVKRLHPRTETDLAFSFFLLLGATVSLQVMLLLLPDILAARPPLDQLMIRYLPWSATLLIIVASTLVNFVTSIGLTNLWPYESRSVISLEGRRLRRT